MGDINISSSVDHTSILQQQGGVQGLATQFEAKQQNRGWSTEAKPSVAVPSELKTAGPAATPAEMKAASTVQKEHPLPSSSPQAEVLKTQGESAEKFIDHVASQPKATTASQTNETATPEEVPKGPSRLGLMQEKSVKFAKKIGQAPFLAAAATYTVFTGAAFLGAAVVSAAFGSDKAAPFYRAFQVQMFAAVQYAGTAACGPIIGAMDLAAVTITKRDVFQGLRREAAGAFTETVQKHRNGFLSQAGKTDTMQSIQSMGSQIAMQRHFWNANAHTGKVGIANALGKGGDYMTKKIVKNTTQESNRSGQNRRTIVGGFIAKASGIQKAS